MKKTLLILVVFCFSCEKEGLYTQSNSNLLDVSNSTLLYQANFVPTSGISVNGSVKILSQNNSKLLQLVNFSITDGPDLKVYLSKTASLNQIVNLGSLNNDRIYSIPNGINLEEYRFVLIHCQAYNHLFAIAQLN